VVDQKSGGRSPLGIMREFLDWRNQSPSVLRVFPLRSPRLRV
jgi:hypothetical protein